MIALVCLLAIAPPNDAAERAERHFAAGEYEAAIAALAEAYAAEPDRAFIFAQGSAYQALDRCPEAVERYEAFLATEPPPEQASKARERIEQCEPTPTEPAAAAVDAAPVPSPTPPPATVPDRPPPRESPRTWHRDVAGGVLLGAGLGIAAAGTSLAIVGAVRRRGADGAGDEGDFRTDLRTSNVLQGVGIGLAVGGGALVIGAIVRYALVGRAAKRSLARLSWRF